jgi:hypothetical protein
VVVALDVLVTVVVVALGVDAAVVVANSESGTALTESL